MRKRSPYDPDPALTAPGPDRDEAGVVAANLQRHDAAVEDRVVGASDGYEVFRRHGWHRCAAPAGDDPREVERQVVELVERRFERPRDNLNAAGGAGRAGDEKHKPLGIDRRVGGERPADVVRRERR